MSEPVSYRKWVRDRCFALSKGVFQCVINRSRAAVPAYSWGGQGGDLIVAGRVCRKPARLGGEVELLGKGRTERRGSGSLRDTRPAGGRGERANHPGLLFAHGPERFEGWGGRGDVVNPKEVGSTLHSGGDASHRAGVPLHWIGLVQHLTNDGFS